MRLHVALVVVAGCSIHADFTGTHYQCGPNGECPSGQTCVANVCVAPGGSDAGADAPSDGGKPARCGTLYMLHDLFQGVTPWWVAWSDGGPSAVVSGGDLVVTVPAGTSDLWAGFQSLYRYDATESAAEAEVTQVGPVDTVLELRTPSAQKLQVLHEAGMLQALVVDSTTKTQAMIPYDPVAQRYWRLREAAGTAYWEYSADGAAWNELYHQADPFSLADVRVYLAAGGEQASGATTAHFASFNEGTPTAPACGVASLVDDFSSAATFTPHLDLWSDSGATVSQTGGQIVVTTNGANAIYGGFESTHVMSLVDSGVYIEVPTAPVIAKYITFVQLLAPSDITTNLDIQLDGNTLYMVERQSGTNIASQGVPFDPVMHRYWRIRGSGSQVLFETSPDATSWTIQYMVTPTIDTTLVQLSCGAGEYAALAGPETTRFGGVNTP